MVFVCVSTDRLDYKKVWNVICFDDIGFYSIQAVKMLLRTNMFMNMSCDIDERKCQSIYFKRKRSRKKRSDNVSDLFKNKLSLALLISIFIILLSFSKRWDFNIMHEWVYCIDFWDPYINGMETISESEILCGLIML